MTEFIKYMEGVDAGSDDEGRGQAILSRNIVSGRLVVIGDEIDLFDLLLWVEKNPLAQFRESPSTEKFEPSDQFKHLFDEQGNVL